MQRGRPGLCSRARHFTRFHCLIRDLQENFCAARRCVYKIVIDLFHIV